MQWNGISSFSVSFGQGNGLIVRIENLGSAISVNLSIGFDVLTSIV